MKQFAIVSGFMVIVSLLLVMYEHHVVYSADDPSLARAPYSDSGAVASANGSLNGLGAATQ
jgi:hypothetical protein